MGYAHLPLEAFDLFDNDGQHAVVCETTADEIRQLLGIDSPGADPVGSLESALLSARPFKICLYQVAKDHTGKGFWLHLLSAQFGKVPFDAHLPTRSLAQVVARVPAVPINLTPHKTCPECRGQKEVELFTSRQRCETCNGEGVVPG